MRLEDQNAIRPTVRDASLRNGMECAPFFKTSDFINGLVGDFGPFKHRPEVKWARDVLGKLDYVAPSTGPDQWIYMGFYVIKPPTE